MPLFHFNVHHLRDVEDADGVDLPDFRVARLEGIRLAGAVLKDEADHFDVNKDWSLEVTDATGLILFVMTFLVTRSSAVPSA